MLLIVSLTTTVNGVVMVTMPQPLTGCRNILDSRGERCPMLSICQCHVASLLVVWFKTPPLDVDDWLRDLGVWKCCLRIPYGLLWILGWSSFHPKAILFRAIRHEIRWILQPISSSRGKRKSISFGPWKSEENQLQYTFFCWILLGCASQLLSGFFLRIWTQSIVMWDIPYL